MTPAEFEALQVGDVVVSDQGDLAVIYDASQPLEKYFVFQDDANAGAIYHDEIEDWSVVSRVLSRENVQPKGGG